MKREDEENLLFICECGDTRDQIIIRFWSDDVYEKDYPSVYVSYYLNKFGFWKRLWHGIRYIFGYTTKWGDFGELILDPSDHEKLYKVYMYLKKAYDVQNQIHMVDKDLDEDTYKGELYADGPDETDSKEENAKERQTYTVNIPFATSDATNGRVYPQDVLREEVKKFRQSLKDGDAENAANQEETKTDAKPHKRPQRML